MNFCYYFHIFQIIIAIFQKFKKQFLSVFIQFIVIITNFLNFYHILKSFNYLFTYYAKKIYKIHWFIKNSFS